ITQRHSTAEAKRVFTRFLKRELNLDPKHYKPNPESAGANKPLWKAREDKAKEAEKKIKRLFKKFNNQANKWIEAVNKQDEKQRKRQENRIKKTIEEARELEQQYKPKSLGLIDKIRQKREETEKRAGRKLSF